MVALTAVVGYLAFVVPQLSRPLMYDDANFALGARAVAETGLPFGNQGWMSDRGDFSHREQWALWHPPLYIYLDGLLARIGGWTPPVLRLLGVAGGLATALLTWRLASDLTRGPPAARTFAGTAAVGLVMLSPLVVQSTLVLDIDFTLLLPLTLLFVWLYLRLEATHRQWLALAPLFALLLWAKMTNPLPLIAVIAVWQLLRGKPARAALHALAIGLGGAALFGASWLGVARWLGFPFDMPFAVNLVQWQDSADVARRAYTNAGAFIDGLQTTVIWLGPGLVALGLIAIALRAGQLARHWQMHRADLLIGLVGVLVVGYVNKNAGWFPKYQAALAPLLACVAAPMLAQAWCVRPRPSLLLAAGAAISAGAITLLLVRDDWALQRTFAIDPPAGAWLVAVVVVGALIGATWRQPALGGATALLGLAIGWSVAMDAVQVRAPYQTDYWYGTTGTAAAADWVSAHLAPGDTYASAKEVAIRSQAQRYVDQDNFVYLLSTGRQFDGTWAGEPLHAVVAWQREPYVADLFQRVLPAAGFREQERFGDYVIYVPVS